MCLLPPVNGTGAPVRLLLLSLVSWSRTISAQIRPDCHESNKPNSGSRLYNLMLPPMTTAAISARKDGPKEWPEKKSRRTNPNWVKNKFTNSLRMTIHNPTAKLYRRRKMRSSFLSIFADNPANARIVHRQSLFSVPGSGPSRDPNVHHSTVHPPPHLSSLY